MSTEPAPLIEQQISDTLKNLQTEVERNGLSEAANEMWLHALALRRVSRTPEPIPFEGRS